jgi:hypothetical protein
MVPMLVTLTVIAASADTLATSALLRPRQALPARMTIGGLLVATDGSSVATARVPLDKVREPRVDPYAEYMSVGPLGREMPQAPARVGDITFSLEPPRRRLRVTISTCERDVSLTVDEILTGRADSRSLVAQYRINPFFDGRMEGLWGALHKAPRVLGPDPTGPPITWLSPTAFSLTTRADTLQFEQEADSVFQVTVRPRLR